LAFNRRQKPLGTSAEGRCCFEQHSILRNAMATYPLHVQREVDRRWAHLVGPAANLVREASAEYVAVRHRADAAALTGTRCTSNEGRRDDLLD